MKIAFDLHGVITSYPPGFAMMMNVLMQTPDVEEVWVISGPKVEDVEQELYNLGIYRDVHYNHIAGIVTHLLEKGYEHTVDEKGCYWFDEKVWWASKAEICRDNNITSLVDDHLEYGDYFGEDHPTTFILHPRIKQSL